MRIYNLDGSYSENLTDNLFGWYLSDIIIDEAIPTFAEHNRKMRVSSQLTLCKNKKNYSKDISRIGFCNSIDSNRNYWNDSNSTYNNRSCSSSSISSSEENHPDINDVLLIDRLEPQIKIQPILNSINCIMAVEGPTKNKKQLLQSITSIESSMKDNLTNLIKPTCSIESKMLLSIISEARYRYFSNNFTNLLKSIFSDCFTNNELMKEIQNYSRGDIDHNMLSLMLQIILANNNFDIDQLIANIQFSENSNDWNNSFSLSQMENNLTDSQFILPINGNSKDIKNVCLYENCDKCKYKKLRMEHEYDSMKDFSQRTKEFQLQLNEIKEYFRTELINVKGLIKETKKIHFELKEMLYLDDVINLLNGKLKIKFIKLPFKILYSHQNNVDGGNKQNFII